MSLFHPKWNREDRLLALAMFGVLLFCVFAAKVCSRSGSQITADRTPWTAGETR